MYIPKHFEISDPVAIHKFIVENSFGQLISKVDNRLFSSHFPMTLATDGKTLHGHMAAQNPQHLELNQQEVLVTFQGPHAYVSPSWYSSSGVPTWNYQAVHIYGRCKVTHELEALSHSIEALAQHYESQFESPWQPQYNPAMLKGIVGFEISISEIQCKYKLSQNKSEEDQQRVATALSKAGEQALADAINENQR